MKETRCYSCGAPIVLAYAEAVGRTVAYNANDSGSGGHVMNKAGTATEYGYVRKANRNPEDRMFQAHVCKRSELRKRGVIR